MAHIGPDSKLGRRLRRWREAMILGFACVVALAGAIGFLQMSHRRELAWAAALEFFWRRVAVLGGPGYLLLLLTALVRFPPEMLWARALVVWSFGTVCCCFLERPWVNGGHVGVSLTGLALAIWVYYHRRLPAEPTRGRRYCPVCDYDLLGNVSGKCPECGTEISPETREWLEPSAKRSGITHVRGEGDEPR